MSMFPLSNHIFRSTAMRIISETYLRPAWARHCLNAKQMNETFNSSIGTLILATERRYVPAPVDTKLLRTTSPIRIMKRSELAKI